jgi:hypothetical protein
VATCRKSYLEEGDMEVKEIIDDSDGESGEEQLIADTQGMQTIVRRVKRVSDNGTGGGGQLIL